MPKSESYSRPKNRYEKHTGSSGSRIKQDIRKRNDEADKKYGSKTKPGDAWMRHSQGKGGSGSRGRTTGYANYPNVKPKKVK